MKVCLFVCLVSYHPCQQLGYFAEGPKYRASDNFTCCHTPYEGHKEKQIIVLPGDLLLTVNSIPRILWGRRGIPSLGPYHWCSLQLLKTTFGSFRFLKINFLLDALTSKSLLPCLHKFRFTNVDTG